MTVEKILIVDDEMLVRNFLAETLKRKNYDVTTADNGKTALEFIKDTSYDIIITDMKMPDLTGIDLLLKIKEISPQTIVIVITAYGSIENAVEAIRLGAFNYIIKPFSPDAIEAVVEKAKEHYYLLHENQILRQQIHNSEETSTLVIGESPIIKKIMKDVIQVAKSNASVFISGESGTGKEVIAGAIHAHSLRHNKPYIKVNCAAVPDTLIESEFFGHEKGAFTGANAKKLGRFELANTGTLLLDEVTEIPLQLQAKLLRAIQEQEFERIGGTKPVKVDVRIISTSNRNIMEAINHKTLREDLYYRLNVVPIFLPPLRERTEDIIPLARFFLEKFSGKNKKELKVLSNEAEKKLLQYNWPGNVRELANIIERAVVMDNSNQISEDHIIIGNIKEKTSETTLPQGITLRELEKKIIIETLLSQKNNRTKTAESLGISIRTLRNKLQEYNGDSKEN